MASAGLFPTGFSLLVRSLWNISENSGVQSGTIHSASFSDHRSVPRRHSYTPRSFVIAIKVIESLLRRSSTILRDPIWTLPTSVWSNASGSYGSILTMVRPHCTWRSTVLLTGVDVPVSSQWQSKGHLYPTQIAQFGLSHWSWLSLNPRTQRETIQQFAQIATSKSISGSILLDFHQIEMVRARHGIRSISRSPSLKHLFISPCHRTVRYTFNSWETISLWSIRLDASANTKLTGHWLSLLDVPLV